MSHFSAHNASFLLLLLHNILPCLGVVVGAELEAVVAPADQVAPAAPVSVILAAVPGPVTVPLPLPTRGLRSAAPPPIEVSPSTSLTWNIDERLHGYVHL